MSLILMEKVEKNLLNLNPDAHCIYVDGIKGSGKPYTRWGRTFDRAHPITMWEFIDQEPLKHDTFKRDQDKANKELATIQRILSQGAVVLFPAEEYSVAIDELRNTSPVLADYISRYVGIWRNL
jgi:hypothetical protein